MLKQVIIRTAEGVMKTMVAITPIPHASLDIVEQRLALCATCPSFNAEQGRCRLCGCFTQAKAQVASARCPAVPPLW